MCQNVNGEIGRVADTVSDNRLSVRSVQPCLSDHWELTVVDPVEVALDGVDGKFARVVVGGLVDDLSVGAVHPGDLNVSFVWENVREVQVLCDPIDGNAAKSGFTDTILDDVRKFATVWTNTIDSVLKEKGKIIILLKI